MTRHERLWYSIAGNGEAWPMETLCSCIKLDRFQVCMSKVWVPMVRLRSRSLRSAPSLPYATAA